jgi:pimeloyl-ACP methyl ester carboxylesterase
MTWLIVILLALAALAFLANRQTKALARQAEALIPASGRNVPVEGGSLHVQELGPADAQPLVLIHGLGGQMHHFTYAVTDLLQDDYRLIVPDRPGCGHSTRDGDAQAELPEQARMLWALLDKLGITEPVLVGHSLGGAVALEMAMQRPGAAGALALVAPLTHEVTHPPEAFKGLNIRARWLRTALAHTIAVPMARRAGPQVLGQIFAPEPWPEDFITRGGGALGLRPQAFLATTGDFLASGRGARQLAGRYGHALKTPGGVLYGDGDAVLDPEAQGRPMEAYGLRFETLPGRGHMLPITAPGETADFVRRMAALAE